MSDKYEYRKIAERYKESRDYSMNTIVQKNTADAKIALNQLEDIVDRALDLINDSDQKEEIYAEAGDMIYNVSGLIEDLKDNVLSLSYMSARKEHRDVKNRIPAEEREEIDQTIKHGQIAKRVASRYRDSDSSMPDAGPPEWIHKDDPGMKTDQRSDEGNYDKDQEESEDLEDLKENPGQENTFKNQDEPRSVNEWGEGGTSFNTPGEIPDDIRFH